MEEEEKENAYESNSMYFFFVKTELELNSFFKSP